MKDENYSESFDEELAMRLTALAMDEASDFERAQLESLMSERPDLLADFERQRQLQALLFEMDLSKNNDSLQGSSDADWKLSDVSRERVLSVIQGELSNPTAQPTAQPTALRWAAVRPANWNHRRLAWWSVGAATAASMLVCVGLLQRQVSPWTMATRPSTGGDTRMDTFQFYDQAASAAAMDFSGQANSAVGEADRDEGMRRSIQFDQSQTMKQLAEATAVLPALVPEVAAEGTDKRLKLSEEEFLGEQIEPNATAGNSYRGWYQNDDAESATVTPSTNDRYAVPSVERAGDAVDHGTAAGVDDFAIDNLEGTIPQQPSASSSRGRLEAHSFGQTVNPDATMSWEMSLGKPQSTEADSRMGMAFTDTSPDNGPVAATPSSPLNRTDVLLGDSAAPTSTKWMDSVPRSDIPVATYPSAMPPLGYAAPSASPRILVDGEEPTQSELHRNFRFNTTTTEIPDAALQVTEGENADRPASGSGELQLNSRISGVASKENMEADEKKAEIAATPSTSLFDLAQEFEPSPEPAKADGLVREDSKDKLANDKLPNNQLEKGKVASQATKMPSITPRLSTDDTTRNLGRKPGIVVPEVGRKAVQSLEEISAGSDPFSTFSLQVSDVSFKLAAAALAAGQWPDPSTIRIEEFVNAFDYFDPLPTHEERVACQIEQAIHPFMLQRNVLRISLRTAATGRPQNIPLRLTLLLDNSGSMERVDRKQTVRRAFESLAAQVKPNDQVTLISFANQPRLLAERVSGSQVAELVQLVENLPSEGGTNLEAALKLAMEKASEEITPENAAGLQNRIVLMTDGAVNLGDANPASLSQLVTQLRDAGIAFDAAGICAQELNDGVLEALTRQGDGRYYLLDSAEDAGDGFADQIAGALRPAAKNVKVQVEFNPDRVGRYKLLGFENHLLKQEDFRNDNVDAAELAAAEAGVAMYQFEANPDGQGDIGSVSVRFQDLATGNMIERRWPIPYEPSAARIHQCSPSLRLATLAAMFAAKLRGDALGESVELSSLADLLATLPNHFETALRVRQLQTMINAARQIGEP